jgi:lauroyl/myristoyl acyltransferase
MHPEAESRFRKYQHTPFLKGVIISFRIASRILPLWFMKTSAIFIIPVFIVFNYKNFKNVIKNISHIKPSCGKMRKMISAYMVFLNYSFYLIDLFFLSHGQKRIDNYHIEVKGEEYLKKIISSNSGFILLTLHMGNWEISGAILSARGITPYIVYSPDSENIIESNRSLLRRLFNIKDISLNMNKVNLFSIKLLNILREGGAVAFQGDRLLGDSGIEVDFFDRSAVFPRGPVILSIVSEAPILPVFCVMKGYTSYEVYIEKPYHVSMYPSREETIKKSLEDIVRIFEKYISLYYEQWYNFMPFWKDDKRG